MNYRKVLLLLVILLLLPFALKVKGNDFGQGQSLFTDIKAHKVGDILTGINGNAVADSAGMLNLVAGLNPGAAAKLTVMRDQKQIELKATVGRRPRQSRQE